MEKLSRREQQVADAAARGLSNRQIAAELTGAAKGGPFAFLSRQSSAVSTTPGLSPGKRG